MQLLSILMATYNGGEFIEAQLDSLLVQSHADWHLWIRDDGSSDGTLEKIRRYVALDRRIHLLEPDGERLGAARSYSALLERFAGESRYSMFCDQDDVWQPDKIALTLAKMREMEACLGRETPIMVHTDLAVADRSLNVVSPSFWRYQGLLPGIMNLNRLLVQNNVTGCTVMANRALAMLASPVPPHAVMHDWWLALIAAAFGTICYVDLPTVLYRQHGGNDIGAKRFSVAHALFQGLGGVGRMRAALQKTQRQAQALLECHGAALDSSQRFLVEKYASLGKEGFFARRWLVCRLGTFKHGLMRNLGMMAVL